MAKLGLLFSVVVSERVDSSAGAYSHHHGGLIQLTILRKMDICADSVSKQTERLCSRANDSIAWSGGVTVAIWRYAREADHC
ncbi:hypothetical protein BJX99DRAFT_236805 [Aspergillus californicus]